RGPGARGVHRPGLGLRRGPLDGGRGDRGGRARARPHRRPVRALRLARRGRLREPAALGDAQAVWRPHRAGQLMAVGHRADALVLFGISGDLARKKLFSALWAIHERGRLTVPVIGVALSDWDDEDLRSHARSALAEQGIRPDDEAWGGFAALLRYVRGDYSDPALYARIKDALGGAHLPVVYLAIPPSLFEAVVEGIAAVGLNPTGRLVLQKPFGRDLASAPPARTSTGSCAGAPPSGPFSASPPPWARRRSSPCWSSGSRTRGPSRSGAVTTSARCRSRWPSRSAWRAAAASTTASGRSGTS